MNEWISKKIRKLIKEGKPQKQAIAIAYSMYEEKGMKKSFISYFLKAIDSKLEYWKKKLLSVLEGNLEKARYEVGAIRNWKDGKYKKIAKDKWVKFYEGDSRGQKQAIANVKRKIQNAKTISELAKIVSQNKNRFKDENGNIHPIVKEILSNSKSKAIREVRTKEDRKTIIKKQKVKPEIKKEEKVNNIKYGNVNQIKALNSLITKNKDNDIYDSIMVDNKNKQLLATNLETLLRVNADINVSKNGLIKMNDFKDFIDKYKSKNISVIEENNKVYIKDDKGNSQEVNYLDSKDFPKSFSKKYNGENAKNNIERERLSNLLERASREETRYFLSGIFFDIDNNKLVSTDARRLMMSDFKIDKDSKVSDLSNFILPSKTVETILKTNPNLKGLKVIKYDGKSVSFVDDKGNQYDSNTINGTFPNYKQIIPDEYKIKFKSKEIDKIRDNFDKILVRIKDLYNIKKQISNIEKQQGIGRFRNEETKDIINTLLDKNNITEDDIREFDKTSEIIFNPEDKQFYFKHDKREINKDVELGLNYSYLGNAFKNNPNEFEILSNKNPIVLKNNEGDMDIVMPMKI